MFGLGNPTDGVVSEETHTAYLAWLREAVVQPSVGLDVLGGCMAWLTAALAGQAAPSPLVATLRSRWLPVLVLAAACEGSDALGLLADALDVADALEALTIALDDAATEVPDIAARLKNALSRLVLRPNGVGAVLAAVLAAARRGSATAAPPAAAMQAAARMLASVPSHVGGADAYYAHVGPQVIALLADGSADVATVVALAVRLGLRRYPVAAQTHWLGALVAPTAPGTSSEVAADRARERLVRDLPVPLDLAAALEPGTHVPLRACPRACALVVGSTGRTLTTARWPATLVQLRDSAAAAPGKRTRSAVWSGRDGAARGGGGHACGGGTSAAVRDGGSARGACPSRRASVRFPSPPWWPEPW